MGFVREKSVKMKNSEETGKFEEGVAHLACFYLGYF